jgi:hypothetical protein
VPAAVSVLATVSGPSNVPELFAMFELSTIAGVVVAIVAEDVYGAKIGWLHS